jgi:hypothetical protein
MRAWNCLDWSCWTKVPGNGESYFVAECHRRLKKLGLAGVISFSDPVPRSTHDGLLVKPGHVGTLCQALSSRLVGRSAPRTLRLLPDGSVLSDRTLQKLRSGEPGTRAVRDSLSSLGIHLPPGPVGEALNPLLDRYTRRLKHSGNYKYAFAFSKAAARSLPSPTRNWIPCSTTPEWLTSSYREKIKASQHRVKL